MHVLFVALNWGMGHASRSVPLIRALLRAGARVTLASDGVAAELFRSEFPDLEVHELPGYKVSYPSRNVYLNVLRSSLSILRAIWLERMWLRRFRRMHQPDAIISDNRYGIVAADIPSVLITHQLRLYGHWKWANRIGEWFMRRWILRFREVWVPDWEGSRSLTGGMATWPYKSPPVLYIGPLSRFEPVPPGGQRDIDILAVLSGPEPQRGIFEQKVHTQLASIPGHHVIVRGTRTPLPGWYRAQPGIEVIDLLPADALQKLAGKARMQVSRSGYSTVMDLVYSGLPALLVPTPGQFEQEYLTVCLQGKGPWQFQHQRDLDIPSAWKALQELPANPALRPSGQEAEKAIADFLGRHAVNRMSGHHLPHENVMK
ncbi:MAG: hypothetical protein J5I41_11785 [Saprospiraceae bacterium]|nr:hypothetical protein [Saprospiraceae bacterium]